MKLKNKSILLVSPEKWDHIFISKHHYSIHLARLNNRVYFLNPPGDRFQVTDTNYSKVYSVLYKGFPKGLRYYPSFLQRMIIRYTFKKIEKLCNTKFDIIWSFDNSVFFDFSALRKNILKISHIVDLNQNFQLVKSSSTADVCFCTTELIKEKLLANTPRVFKINHGFNVCEVNEEITVPGNASTKVLYAGNLGIPYLDWVLIRDLAKGFPDVDFIFLGPNQKTSPSEIDQAMAKKETFSFPNVKAPGVIESNKLPLYYKAADILLVAYQEKTQREQANPHKVMEYLGSGKVIAATYTAEFEDLAKAGLIAMSSRNEEFYNLFANVVKNISTWNAIEACNQRRDFANNNSYAKQIERIEEIIATL